MLKAEVELWTQNLIVISAHLSLVSVMVKGSIYIVGTEINSVA